MVAVMLESMQQAGSYWETTGVLLADKDDMSLAAAKSSLRESYIRSKTNQTKGSAHSVERKTLADGISRVSCSDNEAFMVDRTSEVYNNYYEALSVNLELKNAELTGNQQAMSAEGGRKICTNCPHLFNHWTKDCKCKEPKKSPQQGCSSSKKDMSNIKCHRCGKLGHFAKFCEEEKPINSAEPCAFVVQHRVSTVTEPAQSLTISMMGDSCANVTLVVDVRDMQKEKLHDIEGQIEVVKEGSAITDLVKGTLVLQVKTQKGALHEISVTAIGSRTGQIRKNLLSLSVLAEMGYETVLKKMGQYLKTPEGQRITLKRKFGQYYLDSVVANSGSQKRTAWTERSENAPTEVELQGVERGADPDSILGMPKKEGD
eukprot:2909839-Rhodomonas_salina.1